VCGTNRKIHIAKKEESNLGTKTKGITSFVCAPARVMLYSIQDFRMTAATVDYKRRMGNIRFIKAAIWPQPIVLLQLFTALMLYSQSASSQDG